MPVKAQLLANMAYLKVPKEDQVTDPESQSIFSEIKKAKGFVPAPYRIFSLVPHILQANWNKTKNVLGKGNVSGLLKEKIALVVSVANNCTFCINLHSENLEAKGVTEEEIEKLKKHSFDTDKEGDVLQFAVKTTKNAPSLTKDDFEKLCSEGFDDKDILEILTVTEMYTGYNKIVSALHIEKDD